MRFLFEETRFVRWLGNTALVGVLVVGITLLLAVPAAYSLARLAGRWGERLGIAIFLTYLIPPTLLFIPLSRVVAILGLQDSIFSVVLVYPSMTIPFSIWLLMGFFKSIPKELEDAAMVDGLTRFGAFLKMVVPISVSGILTVVIFSFTLVTQEFVYALTFISPEIQPDGGGGYPDLPRARRRVLLGRPHGGLPDREPADRRPLQPLPRPLHRRLHRRLGQVRGPGRRMGVEFCE